MDNDYIILFDENGSPYIAHAFGDRLSSAATSVGNAATSAYGNAKAGVGRGTRATHKYIDKIVENGRTRYFYTQEELKAYYNEKAKPAINKATQNARAAAGRAATAVGDTASNVAAKGRMVTNQAGEAARNLAANGKTVAANAVNRAGETARNVAQNARSARSEAARRAEEALQRGKSSTAQMRTEFRNKAEQAGRAAGSTVIKAKTAVSNAANQVAEGARNAAVKGKAAVDSASGSARTAIQNGTEVVKETISSAVDEQKRKSDAKTRAKQEAEKREENRKNHSAKVLMAAHDKIDEIEAHLDSITSSSTLGMTDEEFVKWQAATNIIKKVNKARKDYDDLNISESEMNNILSEAESEVAKLLSNRKATVTENNKPHSREKKIGEGSTTVEKGASQGKLNVGSGETSKSAASNAKYPVVDPSKVSKEYVYSLASNSGHSKYVKDTMDAEDTLRLAESEYNRLKNNPNTSQAAINKAEKDMQEAKKQYDDLYSELIRKLNSK